MVRWRTSTERRRSAAFRLSTSESCGRSYLCVQRNLLQERSFRDSPRATRTDQPSHRHDPTEHIVSDHVFDKEAHEVRDLEVDSAVLPAVFIDVRVEYRNGD